MAGGASQQLSDYRYCYLGLRCTASICIVLRLSQGYLSGGLWKPGSIDRRVSLPVLWKYILPISGQLFKQSPVPIHCLLCIDNEYRQRSAVMSHSLHFVLPNWLLLQRVTSFWDQHDCGSAIFSIDYRKVLSRCLGQVGREGLLYFFVLSPSYISSLPCLCAIVVSFRVSCINVIGIGKYNK